jgi:hypothetical protein
MIQGVRKPFSSALRGIEIPFGKLTKREKEIFREGVLSTLYTIHNNFLPDAYIKTPEMEELRKEIVETINRIEKGENS